jgi:hypothetical protein
MSPRTRIPPRARARGSSFVAPPGLVRAAPISPDSAGRRGIHPASGVIPWPTSAFPPDIGAPPKRENRRGRECRHPRGYRHGLAPKARHMSPLPGLVRAAPISPDSAGRRGIHPASGVSPWRSKFRGGAFPWRFQSRGGVFPWPRNPRRFQSHKYRGSYSISAASMMERYSSL